MLNKWSLPKSNVIAFFSNFSSAFVRPLRNINYIFLKKKWSTKPWTYSSQIVIFINANVGVPKNKKTWWSARSNKFPEKTWTSLGANSKKSTNPARRNLPPISNSTTLPCPFNLLSAPTECPDIKKSTLPFSQSLHSLFCSEWCSEIFSMEDSYSFSVSIFWWMLTPWPTNSTFGNFFNF